MNNAIALLQWYYSYFLISLYTDVLLKEGTFPAPKQEITLKTSEQTGIKLNTKRIRSLVEQIKQHPQDKNVFGYLSYISSIKGLFGVFLDMHTRNHAWRKYIQKMLGNKYDAYIQTIRLCRNLLTHQQTVEVSISRLDLERAKDKLLQTWKRIISFSFHYKEIFGDAWNGSPAYWFHISINTATLHQKRTLFDILDEHTLFMIAESIYNLSDHYKTTHA